MKNGAYKYLPVPNSPNPIICEVHHGFVAEVGEEGWRPVRLYPGKFIPLIEDISELEQQWPDMEDVPEGNDMFPHLPVAGCISKKDEETP